MAYIKVIPPGRATGDAAAGYRYMGEMGRFDKKVPKVVQVFSLRPDAMTRMIRTWELSMWMGPEPRTTREMIGAAVSRLNQCHY